MGKVKDMFKNLFKKRQVAPEPGIEVELCDSIGCNNIGPFVLVDAYELCTTHRDLYHVHRTMQEHVAAIELMLNLITSLKILGNDLTTMRTEQNEMMAVVVKQLKLPSSGGY